MTLFQQLLPTYNSRQVIKQRILGFSGRIEAFRELLWSKTLKERDNKYASSRLAAIKS
jgi:hypothetical protein